MNLGDTGPPVVGSNPAGLSHPNPECPAPWHQLGCGLPMKQAPRAALSGPACVMSPLLRRSPVPGGRTTCERTCHLGLLLKPLGHWAVLASPSMERSACHSALCPPTPAQPCIPPIFATLLL